MAGQGQPIFFVADAAGVFFMVVVINHLDLTGLKGLLKILQFPRFGFLDGLGNTNEKLAAQLVVLRRATSV